MKFNLLRQQIACDAAYLILSRQEKDYSRAKMKAAGRLTGHRIRPSDLPRDHEIRDQIRHLTRIREEGGELKEFLSSAADSTDIQRNQESVDRFQAYYQLLAPLEKVKQNVLYHPEGDVLYHSLQVFDLAVQRIPYDEEFLLAALLHDVGKGIDPFDQLNSGLASLSGLITSRTAWLIENLPLAHKVHEKSIGHRQHQNLKANENYVELLALGECERGGHRQGIRTSELEEALDYIKNLATEFG